MQIEKLCKTCINYKTEENKCLLSKQEIISVLCCSNYKKKAYKEKYKFFFRKRAHKIDIPTPQERNGTK